MMPTWYLLAVSLVLLAVVMSVDLTTAAASVFVGDCNVPAGPVRGGDPDSHGWESHLVYCAFICPNDQFHQSEEADISWITSVSMSSSQSQAYLVAYSNKTVWSLPNGGSCDAWIRNATFYVPIQNASSNGTFRLAFTNSREFFWLGIISCNETFRVFPEPRPYASLSLRWDTSDISQLGFCASGYDPMAAGGSSNNRTSKDLRVPGPTAPPAPTHKLNERQYNLWGGAAGLLLIAVVLTIIYLQNRNYHYRDDYQVIPDAYLSA